MNRSGWTKYHWVDEDNKIVHVTETINEIGTTIAHVNLNDASVDVINTEFVEPSRNVTADDQNRILNGARAWVRRQKPPYPRDIRWHEDGMTFETQRESWTWASSVIYNEIGNLYDGYRTTDDKIACSLVFELSRLNTFQGPTFHIFAHDEYNQAEQKLYHLVWVERVVR